MATKKARRSALKDQALAIEADTLAEAYAGLRAVIAEDPLFAAGSDEDDEDDEGPSIEELDRRMQSPPDALDGEALWEWLEGPDQYRYAALLVLLRAFGGAKGRTISSSAIVREETIHVARGDLHVKGHLEVADQAMLVVLGKLEIEGCLIGGLHDYSLVAASEVICKGGVTGGEVIATKRIAADGPFYFAGNDYSACAPRYEGGLLVDFERGNRFSKVKVKKRLTKWDFAAAAKALGVASEDDLAEEFRDRLLAKS